MTHDHAFPLVSVMNQGDRFVPDGWRQLMPLAPSGWHSLALARVSVKEANRHQASSGPM